MNNRPYPSSDDLIACGIRVQSIGEVVRTLPRDTLKQEGKKWHAIFLAV